MANIKEVIKILHLHAQKYNIEIKKKYRSKKC